MMTEMIMKKTEKFKLAWVWEVPISLIGCVQKWTFMFHVSWYWLIGKYVNSKKKESRINMFISLQHASVKPTWIFITHREMMSFSPVITHPHWTHHAPSLRGFITEITLRQQKWFGMALLWRTQLKQPDWVCTVTVPWASGTLLLKMLAFTAVGLGTLQPRIQMWVCIFWTVST